MNRVKIARFQSESATPEPAALRESIVKKFIALLLITALLAGCGEVVVFGHVVREGDKTPEVKPASAPASTPATASSPASQETATSTPSTPSTVNTANPAPSPTASTVVATSSGADTSAPASAPVRHVKDVTLTIAPEVTKDMGNDSRFDHSALLDAVKAELQARRLLESGHSNTGTTLEIYIDHYELHPSTNFVIFGATPNTGKLAGNLALRDEQDNVVTIAHIEAYAHISVPQEGEDRQLLQPLYHEFAVTTADTLAGTHSTSSDVRDQPPR